MPGPTLILVVGGGIGGLTAAIALRQAGIAADVYERASELREVGAGLSIWRNALIALDTLGLGDRIRQFGVPYLNAGLRRQDGRVLVSPSLDTLSRRFGEVAVVLPRAAVQAVLAEALGPAHIHLGTTCTGIERDGDRVSAIFADGARVDADAVIGADGLHSVVRTGLHGDAPPRYSGYTSWRAVTRFDHGRLTVGETWGPGSRFGQVPMAGGLVYWFATENLRAGRQAPAGEKAHCLHVFGRWHDPIPALIDSTPETAVLRNDIFDRAPLRAWGDGRVTLLGDAAHPMTPNLGQGGCQAIEDAVVLARSLKDAPDVVTGLRQYERTRIPRTSKIVEASHRMGAMAQIANPAAIWIRNEMVRLLAPKLMVKAMGEVIGYRV